MDRTLDFLTAEAFSPYGVLLSRPGRHGDSWYQVTFEEVGSPWKLAVYEFDRRSTGRLERHPTSPESFEPLVGVAVLVVATEGAPEVWQAFLLDQPICLRAGVWHQVISLSEYCQVKISENLVVTSEFHDLAFPVTNPSFRTPL